jgi:hypothetical protein
MELVLLSGECFVQPVMRVRIDLNQGKSVLLYLGFFFTYMFSQSLARKLILIQLVGIGLDSSFIFQVLSYSLGIVF